MAMNLSLGFVITPIFFLNLFLLQRYLIFEIGLKLRKYLHCHGQTNEVGKIREKKKNLSKIRIIDQYIKQCS